MSERDGDINSRMTDTNNINKNIYSGEDLAIIIPTKDRPQKIVNLLDSLSRQSTQYGRIIVVDGGKSIKNIVAGYSKIIPVEYMECSPPGQIRQKNMALKVLDKRTKLVGYLDDDIVLENGSIEAMIKFINSTAEETAGVSFNIVNSPQYRYSWIKALIGLSAKIQGLVLRSGYNVPILAVNINQKSQWVSGGATVWKKEIVQKFIQKEVSSRWASCEDLIFSYPIGKLFPLYVCADAQVRHEHVYDQAPNKNHRYYGYTETIWRFYFVHMHEELSIASFVVMILATIIGRFVKGIVSVEKRQFEFAIGSINGLRVGFKTIRSGKIFRDVLDEGIPT
jgi:glycosyltransferase involved in cell wall biosynthesis